MSEELQFEADTHTYRFAGQVVPGVTSVLEQLQYLQGVPWALLESARHFGNHVHMACDLFNRGDLDEDSLDPNLAPYLAAYKQFLSQTGFVVTASEQFVHHKRLRYAGRADLFGTWKDTTWVVDLKSGEVPFTIGAQLAAYQGAAVDRPRRRLCVQLGPDGYRLFEQKDLSDFSLFTSALNCYQFLKKHHPRKLDHANQSRRFEDSAT